MKAYDLERLPGGVDPLNELGDVALPEMVNEWNEVAPDDGGFMSPEQLEPEEPTKLSAAERIAMGYDRAGFYTHSSRELNHTIGVLETIDTPGGVGRYFNEILTHQNKSVSERPDAALRVIVSEMKSYAEDARASNSMLGLLKDELPTGSNLETLQRSSSIAGWKYQPATKRALTVLARRQQLYDATGSDSDQSHRVVNEAYEVDDAAVAKLVGSMRSGEAKSRINQLQQEEAKRALFWVEALKSARSHLAVAGIAKAALRQILGPTASEL